MTARRRDRIVDPLREVRATEVPRHLGLGRALSTGQCGSVHDLVRSLS